MNPTSIWLDPSGAEDYLNARLSHQEAKVCGTCGALVPNDVTVLEAHLEYHRRLRHG